MLQDEFIYRTQDKKFVEWSRGVDANNQDIKFIAAEMKAPLCDGLELLDVGGGIGTAAASLADECNARVDVIDFSPLARDNFVKHERVSLVFADFFRLETDKKYDAVLFRLVLHHFVGASNDETRRLQLTGLRRAAELLKNRARVFILEDIYEPYLGEDNTGRLIYEVAKMKSIKALTFRMGANTAGEGVRFRSLRGWKQLIEEAGLEIIGQQSNLRWGRKFPAWQRLPLLCRERYQLVMNCRVKTSEAA